MDLITRQKLIADQIESGLSARAFCTKNNINYSNFMYYRKTVHEHSHESAPSSPTFLEIASRKKSLQPLAHSQFIFQFASCTLFIPTSLPEKDLSQLFLALRKTGLC